MLGQYNGSRDEAQYNVIILPTKITDITIENNKTTNTTITMTITDDIYNNKVNGGNIILKDTQGNSIQESMVIDGKATFFINTLSEGEYNLIATYTGLENIYNITEENVPAFMIEKSRTETTATLTNNTSGSVTINVKTTTEDNQTIKGKVTITNENGDIIKEVENVEGETNITLPDIKNKGNYTFNVTFTPEDDRYETSKDVLENEKISGKDLNVNVTVTGQEIDDINITLNITDEKGNPVESVTPSVTDENGINYPVTKNPDGTYNINTTTMPVGENNLNIKVTSENPEYENYEEQIPIRITATPEIDLVVDSQTKNNTTLHVTVIGKNGLGTPTGVIVATNDNGNIIATGYLDQNGQTTIKLDVDKLGPQTFEIIYLGDNTYEENSTQVGIDIISQAIINDEVLNTTRGNVTVEIM